MIQPLKFLALFRTDQNVIIRQDQYGQDEEDDPTYNETTMGAHPFDGVLGLLLLFLFGLAPISLLASIGTRDIQLSSSAVEINDSLALVALYNSTDGDNWNYNNNWLTGPVSTWLGITVADNRVTEIFLSSLNLNGSIPSEMQQLTALTVLSMYGNSLLKGDIPTELGQLSNLLTLDLHSNGLTGSIPAELGQLSNLVYLYLYYNKLSGSIPAQLGQLPNLERLYLYNNSLSGSIPAELGQLSKIKYIFLSSNQLSGSIPTELGQLSTLYYLNLCNNKLSGSIPSELGQLTGLVYLYLYSNKLSGDIPSEISGMTNLYYLRLSSNALTGSIPAEIAQCTLLRQVYLDMNQLDGAIPPELGSLPNLQILDLSINQLSGSIPVELGQLTSLTSLDLSINELSGIIPDELGQLSKLTQLILERNGLSGDIPKSFNQLENLESLTLGSNDLTGFLCDSLFDITSLSSIIVYYNQLTFEDLEDQLKLNDKYFYYSPQGTIGQSQVLSLDTGVNYTLTVECGGSQNSYQWFFNGELFGSASEDPNYKLTDIGDDDIGIYYCEVTNSLVDNLVITSEPITLQYKTIGEQPPTDITLSSETIDEAEPIGTRVGVFSSEDEDYDDSHIYTLVDGDGDDNNGSFFIASDQLHSNEVFDFETQSSYTIRIRTKDNAGNSYDKIFILTVNDINELPPTDITLLGGNIDENAALGTFIGLFTTQCGESYITVDTDTYTYALVDGDGDDDNASFIIADNLLLSGEVFNYESKASYTIRVQTEDELGNLFDLPFTITINDEVEEFDLFIPDAFSPNGDGKNDYFEIQGLNDDQDAKIAIYNRYGNLVFQNDQYGIVSDALSAGWWDGCLRANGKIGTMTLPEGYYYMVLQLSLNEVYKKAIYLKE